MGCRRNGGSNRLMKVGRMNGGSNRLMNGVWSRFTRFNALMNGVSNRLTAVLGDLYDPVRPGPFDCILANPPFVPVPPGLGVGPARAGPGAPVAAPAVGNTDRAGPAVGLGNVRYDRFGEDRFDHLV